MRGSGMAGERENMTVSSGRGGEWSLGNIWMGTWRDGKGVIEVEVLVELISWFGS